MALRLLSRSAAALVAQQLGPAAQRLPSDWNPFASLAGDSCVPSQMPQCTQLHFISVGVILPLEEAPWMPI